MNFWENVDAELEFVGMSRKTLADKAGFDVSNIGKGIKNGNVPAADTAVKIARALHVSVEFLVTGRENYLPKNTRRNVASLVRDLNMLSDKQIFHLHFIIKEMAGNLK